MLNILSGSTDFKQGLTIILDDYNSTLPLNPTKQDLSFAFKEYGETHKVNLNCWLSGITSFFWKYHFEGTGNSSKAKLRQYVTDAATLFDNAIASKGVRPLSEMEPIRFKNLKWSQKKVAAEDEEGRDASYMKLQVTGPCRQKAKLLKGRDTLVQLSDLDSSKQDQKERDAKKKTKKRRKAPARGTSKKKAKVSDESDDEESEEASIPPPPPPRRRKQTARKSVKKPMTAAQRPELMAKQKEMHKAKEDEIKVLQREKDEELKALQKEKNKEIKVLKAEKNELQMEVESAVERVAELQKALEVAKRARKAKDGKAKSGNYVINFRIKNCESDRIGDITVPADVNRSIEHVLKEQKIIQRDKLLKFPKATVEKLKKKEVVMKVGLWDPSRADGDYSYIYDVGEMKTETTLQLFNFLTRDGMELFHKKYDPAHLCIFLEDKEMENEDEVDYLF